MSESCTVHNDSTIGGESNGDNRMKSTSLVSDTLEIEYVELVLKGKATGNHLVKINLQGVL